MPKSAQSSKIGNKSANQCLKTSGTFAENTLHIGTGQLCMEHSRVDKKQHKQY
jgi:hypothetical protein